MPSPGSRSCFLLARWGSIAPSHERDPFWQPQWLWGFRSPDLQATLAGRPCGYPGHGAGGLPGGMLLGKQR